MPKSAQDLIDGVRSRTNTERTQHVTDPEILTWLNDEGDQFYNKLVASREEYVVRTTQFTLNTPFFEETDNVAVVNGYQPTITDSVTQGMPLTGPFNAAPDYYKIYTVTIRPMVAVNTGVTQFEIKKNGVLTGVFGSLASGATDPLVLKPDNVTFVDGDTIAIEITCANSSAGWNCSFYISATPFVQNQIANGCLVPDDFLKPVKISFPLGNGRRQEALPIDSDHNTAVACEFTYRISDQKILIYPEINPKLGPYDLEYCPRWKELVTDPVPNFLIKEMERFSDILELGAAAMVKAKRKMPEDVALMRALQADMAKDGIASIPGRKGGPKHIPLPLSEHRRMLGYRNRRYF